MTVSERHVNPEPAVDRPHMPDGYLSEASLAGFVPWEHVRQRMTESPGYWISTTRPDGRPHATPIWGMWLDDTFYFDGSPQTTRGRNIAANPRIAVHLESADDVVIMEGRAYQIEAPSLQLRERLAAAYSAKYASRGYEPGPETWEQGGLYIFHIDKALAWTAFDKDPTRWTFS
ncbi:MAG TPA: pyridoxamine 5'-phosphate oxidase family protein [Thermomicrobiales bacterium]|nr:pyridoxamine 5'-phosphate oxidase family protein [Thermomicrobiales bacterium]